MDVAYYAVTYCIKSLVLVDIVWSDKTYYYFAVTSLVLVVNYHLVDSIIIISLTMCLGSKPCL